MLLRQCVAAGRDEGRVIAALKDVGIDPGRVQARNDFQGFYL